MLEILILSLVQGVTEFLPISSSSHIILFSKFMNFITMQHLEFAGIAITDDSEITIYSWLVKSESYYIYGN